MWYERNPRFVELVDKCKVKDFARSRGVDTAKSLFVTDRPERIPFEDLPADYFIKANHGWRWNILCSESRHRFFGDGSGLVSKTNSECDRTSDRGEFLTHAQVLGLCTDWLGRKHSRHEWAYHQVAPKILVEERLVPAVGDELRDYRMYTFGGTVKVIGIGSPSHRKNRSNVLFDPSWNPIDLSSYEREGRPERLPEKPGNLSRLIGAAECIGEEIDFARIDLYDTTKGIMLGEITLYPEAGIRSTPTSCPKFNRWLGKQWRVDRTHYISRGGFLRKPLQMFPIESRP